jgi:hypothetical protein
MSKAVTIYLIHAQVRYGHAAHYLGVTKRESLVPRMTEHLTGRGCTLVKLLADRNNCHVAEDVIDKMVVAMWQGTRGEERRLKNRGGLGRICPTCRAAQGKTPYQPRPNRQGRRKDTCGTAQSNSTN